jgi:hypothetical protein
MGRYDALTQLEDIKDKQNASETPPAKKPTTPVSPVDKEKYATLLANQQTSKEVNLHYQQRRKRNMAHIFGQIVSSKFKFRRHRNRRRTMSSFRR